MASLPTKNTIPFLSGDELLRMPDIGRAELVGGQLVTMPPTGHEHGYVENRIGRLLGEYAEQAQLGRVLTGEVGIYTKRNPDTVRGADLVYISHERFTQVQRDGYLEVAPELVVEVLSPHDRWADVIDKLAEYFAVGVLEVWVVDPRRKELFLYNDFETVSHFTKDDEVKQSRVFPKLELRVCDLFR